MHDRNSFSWWIDSEQGVELVTPDVDLHFPQRIFPSLASRRLFFPELGAW